MNGRQDQKKHDAHGELVARFKRQADEIRRLTSGLDDASLSRRTAAEKWSLKELVCHLWRVQQVFEERVDAMLRKDNPEIAPYEPDGDEEFDRMAALPGPDLTAGFFASRDELVARLHRLSPADWHRKGRHPEFPNYDIHFQLEYMAHHEAHHIYQIFQRRAPLGKLPH